VPSAPRPPAPRALVGALLALTFTTGIVDAVCFLGLGRVFTANMTGNVVLLGFGLAGTDGLPVLAPLVSLAAFAAGAAVAGVAIRRTDAAGAALLGGALAGEALLAAVAAIVAGAADVEAGTFVAGVVIALLAFAMGLRNAVVRKLAVPELTTTVLTMTVTGLAADGRAAASAQVRRLSALGAMLLGALAGALLVEHTLWVPLAVVAALAAALSRVVAGAARRA
jgi:uncharacterized membrane protein YoaK (UPF0700 family)